MQLFCIPKHNSCIVLLHSFGPRFPAVTPAYCKDLRKKFLDAVKGAGLEKITHEGVYCNVAGPSYETIAELNLFLKLGGDAIGNNILIISTPGLNCQRK